MNVEFDGMIKQHQLCLLYSFMYLMRPTPVAARSQTWVWGRSLAGTVGSNPAGGMDSVCCECCVSSGRDLRVELITRPEESHTECDRETSIMRRPWPTRSCCAMEEKRR